MSAEAQFNKAILLIKDKEYVQAIKLLNSLSPSQSELIFKKSYLLALCFEKNNDINSSIKFYLEALKVNPNHLPTLFNLSSLYEVNNDYEMSIKLLKKCILIENNFIEAKINLSSLYLKTKNFISASKLLNEDFYLDVQLNLNKLYVLYELRDHINFIQLARKIKKSFNTMDSILKSNYYTILGVYFYYFKKINLAEKFLKKSISYSNKSKAKKHLKAIQEMKILMHELYNPSKDLNSSSTLLNNNLPLSNYKNKLKICFLSSDFREHAVSYQLYDFLIFLLKEYSDQYDFYFLYNFKIDDEITLSLKKFSKNWLNISGYSDEQVFEYIKKLSINILFDLNGMSEGNRISLYTSKPADILINWCGWLTSIRNDNFDFILGDKYVFENFNKSSYSEKPLILNRIWSTISKSLIKNKPQLNKEKQDETIFFCPQRFDKINTETILVWKNIINDKNTNKLYLLNSCYSDYFVKKRLLRKFQENNFDSKKIEFFNFNDRFSYLEFFKKVDIALDTFPYSAGTTAFELSYMLIPNITLKKNHFISNSAYSINSNLEVEACISSTRREYIDKALELSRNKTLYKEVKKKLVNKVYHENIYDYKKFTLDFVNLFREL